MKMNFTRLLLALLVALVGNIPAFAYDFEVDGIYYNTLSLQDLTCEVTYEKYENYSYKSAYSGEVVIPSSVTYAGKTLEVTSIGDRAFYKCNGLTSITIPNSVTEIGGYAFYYCSSLTSINIPNSVTEIGSAAFYYCSSLTSINIPNCITEIGEMAFSGCSGLTSVIIPNSVTSIGSAAFSGCSSLTSVTIPNSVTSIGSAAFNACASLPVENGIRYADTYAVEAIDKNQVSYTIKEGTRFIGSSAFFYYSGLTSITIPNSVTSIGERAFSGCSGLTSITIPNSVTSIGSYAFNGCKSLPVENGIRYADTYAVEAIDKNQVSYTIKEGTRFIGSSAFSDCSNLKSFTIPNSVTEIGSSAFSGCSSLTSITIGNSVTSIGSSAFNSCSGLTSATIGNSVTSIGKSAFNGCSGLTSVTIGNSVTSISESAFNYYGGLTSVYITDIAAWCKIKFDNSASNPLCNAHNLYLNNELVTNLVIPNGVTSIGNYAFYKCNGLTSINIPNCITSIGSAAFSGCSSLTSINIPNSIKEIGASAFRDCSGLATITIQNGVTSVGSYTFSGCTSLNTVEIPNSVKSISETAFYNSSINTLKLGNGIEEIKSNTFGCCNEIYVSWASPAGLNIARDAFTDNYKSTLYVPIGCTGNYQTRSPWNDFKEIKEYALGGNEGDEKCAAPEIRVENNKLLFSSSTPGSKFYYTIDCLDQTMLANSENGEVDLSAIYKISAYAYAEGYQNSENVTATLVWVNPTLDDSGVLSMEAKKAVVIRSLSSALQISGTERGERIELYSAGGMSLSSVVANEGETVVPCNARKGEVVVVKYGGISVKYRF